MFVSQLIGFGCHFVLNVSFNIFPLLVKTRFRLYYQKEAQEKKNGMNSSTSIEEKRGKSPTGDRLSKTGHQHSIVYRIGDQSVAIPSPGSE